MPENERYLKKIVPQHKRPKFMEWLKTNLASVDAAVKVFKEIETAYEIDKALGVQLDVTGEIVGRDRVLNFEPPLGLSPMLDDDIYRILQTAKISLNQWDGSMQSANELLEELFPQYKFILQDNQDMTLTFYTFGEPSVLEREFMSRGYITPKPSGVRIRYDFILPDLELDETLYIGSILDTDASWNELQPKTINDMSFNINLGYASSWWDVGYIEIPSKTK